MGKKRWRRTSQLRRRPNADDQKTSEDRFQQQEIRTRLQHSQHRRFNRFEDGAVVGIDELVASGVIKKVEPYGLKVLGNGELEKKLTIKANKFTASAIEKSKRQAAQQRCYNV